MYAKKDGLRRRDALKEVVPWSFDIDNQKFHGHLYKREIQDFCDTMKIKAPQSVSCFQAFVSTGLDVEDNMFKVAVTTLDYSEKSSESVVTDVSDETITKVEEWFEARK